MAKRWVPLLSALAVAASAAARGDPPPPGSGLRETARPPASRCSEASSLPEPGVLAVLGRLVSLGAREPSARVAGKSPDAPADPRASVEDRVCDNVAHDLTIRREVCRKVARLLELSYLACDQGRFDRCARICDEILAIDPEYPIAVDLKRSAQAAAGDPDARWHLGIKVSLWKQMTDDDDEAVIPLFQDFRFPSHEAWADGGPRRLEPASLENPEADRIAIHRKLEHLRISLEFLDVKFEDVLAFIRDFSGLNIVLDAAVRDRVDPERTLSVFYRDLALRDALTVVLSAAGTGLFYKVTREQVLLLTDWESAFRD